MNFDSGLLKQCWFLAGPTAVGKTGTSLALAQQLNAEIISMDSMAIYRHMDIGTAKPSAAEQAVVPHHLIDVVDPHQEFSVAEFVRQAEQIAREIVNRGGTPLFVGGTGLYLRSVLRGVFEGPQADWDLRKDLQQQLEQHGSAWLHQQLAQVDEVTAKRLHENDTRRVIRALEVYRLTGTALSQQHDQQPRAIDERPVAVFWLDPPRSWLHDRINARVDRMMEEGFLQETQQLLQLNPPAGRTAKQAIGYRELISHLNDQISLDDAVEQIKTGTRQFAKRQHTWFRNLEECTSVAIDANLSADQLASELVRRANTG